MFALALLALLAEAPPRAQGAPYTSGPGVAEFDQVWQTVKDTFYDPTFGGIDWAAVRNELRPRAALASDPAALRVVIRDMLSRLGQSHFTLLAPAADSSEILGEASVPFDVRVTKDGVLVTGVTPGSSADAAGVHVGDRVMAIDGRGIDIGASGASGAADPTAATRDLLAWRRVAVALSGEVDSRVRLRLRAPNGAEREVAVVRAVEEGVPVAVGNLPAFRTRLTTDEVRTPAGRRVGLIRFNVWMTSIAQPFADAIDRFRQADGLVIDLRGNPGGLADMMRGIAGHLVSEPVLIGRMHMRDADLEFRANPRRSTADGRSVEPYAGPVAVLVDGLTGSASECFAGGLQSLGRVRVFGTTTMGQALPASTKTLSNGDVLMFAVGDFVTSTGLRLEGRGVVPDELVPMTPEALSGGADAIAAALKWLDRGKGR